MKELYKPFYSKKLTPKDKKYSVYVIKNGRKRLIHFGNRKYQQYFDRLGKYSKLNHLDKKRKRRYLARASKIRNKNKKLTKNDRNSANYYAIRYLWDKPTLLGKGGSLLSRLKKVGKKIKQGAKTLYNKIIKPGTKYAYALGANTYRIKNCPSTTRLLEPGEFHYGCHNYTGPGTLYEKYPNEVPYNGIDECSKVHDAEYHEIFKIEDPEERAKAIHESDLRAINCYNQYQNDDGYNEALIGISGKYTAEQLASLYKGKKTILYDKEE